MKILVIRFSSIGDIVLTSPVLRCLKEQLKDVEIHALTKEPFAFIFEQNPHVDKTFTIRKSVIETISELKAEKYDHIIDLHNNLRSKRVKLQLGRASKSFKKLNYKKWLLAKHKINRMPDVHIVDRYMRCVEHLGVTNDEKGLDYFIPQQDEIELPFKESYIAFAVGAKHYTKEIPVDKSIDIIERLKLPIVLLGGKEDVEKAKKIEAGIIVKIYNACGKYSLNQSAFVIKNAASVITPDTGLMHIAAAFKKKVYSVWGSTVPDFGMYPYKPGEGSKIIEVKGLDCRPCSKIGYSRCPQRHFNCMKKVEVESFKGLNP